MKRAALFVACACHASSTSTTTTTSTTTATATASVPTAASVTPTVSASAAPPSAPRTIAIAPHGIGFDDLVFSSRSDAILAPAGATGKLALIHPQTFAVESRVAFEPASPPAYTPGHHDEGLTSAAEMPGRVLVTDRTHQMLDAFEGGTLAAHVALASSPDYVRFVAPTSEIWVTEPDAAQIEILSPTLARVAKIAVPGGPESLVVSASRHAAYSNLWHQKSVEIDLASRAIKRTFDTKCEKTRGIALDDAGGGLFVACNDGRVVRVDLASGKVSAEGRAGPDHDAGVDIIDFSPKTKHLYVPAARAGTLTVFDANLSALKTVSIPKGAHCVAADDRGQAWLCDPDHGSLVVYAESP